MTAPDNRASHNSTPQRPPRGRFRPMRSFAYTAPRRQTLQQLSRLYQAARKQAERHQRRLAEGNKAAKADGAIASATTAKPSAIVGRSMDRLVYACSCAPAALLVFFQLKPGDRLAVDFVGAVGQAQRALVRPCAGQVEVLADAAAAVGLKRAVDHTQGHVRRDDFDHGDLGARRLVAHSVHHISRFEREQSSLLYF